MTLADGRGTFTGETSSLLDHDLVRNHPNVITPSVTRTWAQGVRSPDSCAQRHSDRFTCTTNFSVLVDPLPSCLWVGIAPPRLPRRGGPLRRCKGGAPTGEAVRGRIGGGSGGRPEPRGPRAPIPGFALARPDSPPPSPRRCGREAPPPAKAVGRERRGGAGGRQEPRGPASPLDSPPYGGGGVGAGAEAGVGCVSGAGR
jgi:hypothetical protein